MPSLRKRKDIDYADNRRNAKRNNIEAVKGILIEHGLEDNDNNVKEIESQNSKSQRCKWSSE